MIYDFTDHNGNIFSVDMKEVLAINHYKKKDHLAILLMYSGRDIPVMLDKIVPPEQAHEELDIIFNKAKDSR